jgi:hypothetical protein
MTSQRLYAALGAYAALAGAAWFTLDGKLRLIVLVVLAGYAFKSWIGFYKDQG